MRAQYVVAADGNRSPAGSSSASACAAMACCPTASPSTSASGDLGPLLADRNQGVHYVTNPLMRGFFRLDRSGNGGFLVVNLVGDTARPEIVAAFP